MKIRLIAADLDGTLFRADKTISPRTLKALQTARERGCVFVPATGRVRRTIPAQVFSIPGVRHIITSNGAAVYDLAADTTVYTDLMTPAQAERFLSRMCAQGFLVEAYANGLSYAHRPALEGMLRLCPPEWLRRVTLEQQIFVDDLPSYVRENGLLPEKLNLPFLPAQEHERVLKLLAEMGDCCVCSSAETNVEINTATCSKGSALRALCGLLGIGAQEVMTFGDGGNDAEMLRWAGLGIAMGNAAPEARGAAAEVTGSNEEDGVASAIEKYFPA